MVLARPVLYRRDKALKRCIFSAEIGFAWMNTVYGNEQMIVHFRTKNLICVKIICINIYITVVS